MMNKATEWWLEDKAKFCLTLGIAPSEYDQMTRAEVNAFIKQYNDSHKKK